MMYIRSSRRIQRSGSHSFNLRNLVYLLLLCLFIYISVKNAKGIAGETHLLKLHISTITPPAHSLNTDSRSRQVDNIQDEDETPVCRVALVNKVDWHYEIIESTILQFPLPWEKLGCNVTASGNKTPIIAFDVALVEEKNLFLNEKQGWIDYFTTHLKGRVKNRADGLVRAQFGDIVSYMNYTDSYSAIIGVSCDRFQDYDKWMEQGPHTNFCVLHKTQTFKDPSILERVCWLNPMHEQCFYLPTGFPQFPESTQQEQKSQASINLCVSGKLRNHDELAQALANAPKNVTQSLRLRILQQKKDIPKVYTKQNLTGMVDIIRTNSFIEFQKAISECNVLLPLIGPEKNPDYFVGLKRLTGCIPQAIAYKLPTVMHAELYDIYKDYLTAPSRTYTNATSFATALTDMVSVLTMA